MSATIGVIYLLSHCYLQHSFKKLCYKCATTMLLFYDAKNRAMILRVPARRFAYTHKAFCVYPQGVLRMPARLRGAFSDPAQRRVVPGVQACKPLRGPFGRAKRYYLVHLERKDTSSLGLSAVIFNSKMTQFVAVPILLCPPKVTSEQVVDDFGTSGNQHRNDLKVTCLQNTV